MFKSPSSTPQQAPRSPLPALLLDKGRKHEAFEVFALSSDRRSQALAQRFDRKR